MDTPYIIIFALLGFFVLLFFGYLFLMMPGAKRRGRMAEFKNYRYAHRGLHGGGVAENSRSAFVAAVDAGYGIELDVRLSSDGEIVVFHDDTLDRVTGQSGFVKDKTAKELSEIKLLGTDDTIPTFREVLELVGGRVPLLVELKEDQGSYGVTEAAVKMLSEYEGPYIIESFNPLALARVKKLAPEVLRGVLSHHFTLDKKYRGFKYFLLQNLCLNCACRPDFIAFNHEHRKMLSLRLARLFGAPTLAWTVESERDDAEALKCGFDGIIFQYYAPDVKTENKDQI